MKIIGKKILDDFVLVFPEVRTQIEAWLAEASGAEWRNPIELKARYSTASILKAGGVVFNLKGNAYRLYVKISYKNKIVSVRKIGTHRQYEKWNLEE